MNDKDIIKRLNKYRESVKSPQKLLRSIIDELSVTEAESVRYKERKKNKGRSSIEKLLNISDWLIMNKKAYIGAAVVILLLIAGFGLFSQREEPIGGGKLDDMKLVELEDSIQSELNSLLADLSEASDLIEDPIFDNLDDDLLAIAE